MYYCNGDGSPSHAERQLNERIRYFAGVVDAWVSAEPPMRARPYTRGIHARETRRAGAQLATNDRVPVLPA